MPFESAHNVGYDERHMFVYNHHIFDIHYIGDTLHIWRRRVSSSDYHSDDLDYDLYDDDLDYDYMDHWYNPDGYDEIVTAAKSWYTTGGAGMALWEYLNAVLGDL
jgi:hypothetical protein